MAPITTGVRIDPSPIVSAISASKMPKTRARTSSGARRVITLKPETSSSALPRPMTASMASADASAGITPMTISGRPHSAMLTPNHAPSRPLPTKRDAPTEPRTAPAPTAADRMPTPDSPMSSNSMAITTVRTFRQPRVKVWETPRPMNSARSRFAASA